MTINGDKSVPVFSGNLRNKDCSKHKNSMTVKDYVITGEFPGNSMWFSAFMTVNGSVGRE